MCGMEYMMTIFDFKTVGTFEFISKEATLLGFYRTIQHVWADVERNTRHS